MEIASKMGFASELGSTSNDFLDLGRAPELPTENSGSSD